MLIEKVHKSGWSLENWGREYESFTHFLGNKSMGSIESQSQPRSRQSTNWIIWFQNHWKCDSYNKRPPWRADAIGHTLIKIKSPRNYWLQWSFLHAHSPWLLRRVRHLTAPFFLKKLSFLCFCDYLSTPFLTYAAFLSRLLMDSLTFFLQSSFFTW